MSPGGRRPAQTQQDSTRIGPRRRWPSALGWSGLVFIPAYSFARSSEYGAIILPLGALAAAAVFLAQMRQRPITVSDTEVQLPKRTIPRDRVARIVRNSGWTALIFRDAAGQIVDIANVHEDLPEYCDALTKHGWPDIE